MTLLENNIINLYGDKGKVWLDDLPCLTEEIAEKWHLENLAPVSNLSYNYVLSGFRETQPIVLKLSLDTLALDRETAALMVFDGYGGVPVLDQTEGALLLEHVIPGHSLKNHLPNDKSIQIMCNVMKKLHQASLPNGGPFPHIHDWLTTIDKEWDIPNEYLRKARELKNKFLETDGNPVLLHGDLHHDNVLANGNDWVVIDPKGVIGDPIHEVWTFIMDLEKDTQYVADFFDFNVTVVRQWYFVRAILAACWSLEDNGDPKMFLDLAAKAFSIS
jgi:streptomycin 6-kinase